MIRDLIKKGDFSTAKSFLEEIEVDSTDIEALIALYYYRAVIACEFKHFEDGLRYAEAVTEQMHTVHALSSLLFRIVSLLIRAQAYIGLRKFVDAENVLTSLHSQIQTYLRADLTLGQFLPIETDFYVFKGLLNYNKENYREALKDFKQALKSLDKNDYPYKKMQIYEYMAKIYFLREDYDNALEYYRLAVSLAETLARLQDEARYFNNIGVIYFKKGDMNEALKYLEQSRELREKLGNTSDLVSSYNNIGLIYYQKGELRQSLKCYKKGLAIAEQEKDVKKIIPILVNIGKIYHTRGFFDIALKYYRQSLELLEKLGMGDEPTILRDLGHIYHQKRQFDAAQHYYERALSFNKMKGKKLKTAISLFDLLLLALDKNEISLAQKYLREIVEIRNKMEENNNFLRHLAVLAEALTMEAEKKEEHVVKAKHLLKKIVDEPIVDFQLTIKAIFHLTEISLRQYLDTQRSSFITESIHYIDLLNEIGKKQRIRLLIADALLLRGLLQSLEQKYEAAEKNLLAASEFYSHYGHALKNKMIKEELKRVKKAKTLMKNLDLLSEMESVQFKESIKRYEKETIKNVMSIFLELQKTTY